MIVVDVSYDDWGGVVVGGVVVGGVVVGGVVVGGVVVGSPGFPSLPAVFSSNGLMGEVGSPGFPALPAVFSSNVSIGGVLVQSGSLLSINRSRSSSFPSPQDISNEVAKTGTSHFIPNVSHRNLELQAVGVDFEKELSNQISPEYLWEMR